MTTTNAIYRCEEFEDAVSVYDDIQEDTYDDLSENNIYLDVLGDDETAEGCVPQPPSPRPVTEAQDQNKDNYDEGLKEEMPDHTYLRGLSEETESTASRDQVTRAEDKEQGSELQE